MNEVGERGKMLIGVLGDVMEEYNRAHTLYPQPIHSPLEGLAVVEEQLSHLRKKVRERGKQGSEEGEIERECIQVAAMCVRMVVDVIKNKSYPMWGGREHENSSKDEN